MLKDKIILVTGGSGLLGKEMIADIRNKGGIPINLDVKVERDLSKNEWTCDITSDNDIKESVSAILKQYGRIDGLVNNAYPRTSDWGASFEEITAESWRQNVDWQLNSYFLMSREVLVHMKNKKTGTIVNIGSIYGVVGNDFTLYESSNIRTAPAYSAIKGGLINLTRYMAALYGQHGIRINCVSPGGIFDNQDLSFVSAYEKRVPLKRMGRPDDIAPAVSFLLSSESKYITGQNLLVDGGWTAI